MNLTNDPQFLLDEHKRRVGGAAKRAEQLATICRQPRWPIRQLATAVALLRRPARRRAGAVICRQPLNITCEGPRLA